MLDHEIKTISVVGLGYVGIVTSACLTDVGYNVICADIDKEKIELVNEGKSPIFEPQVPELIKKALEGNKLLATTNIKRAVVDSELTFVTVGTPTVKGKIDLTAVRSASETIGKGLAEKNSYHVVAVKSTVIPGTTEHVVIPIIEKSSKKQEGVDFGVCSNPEFLREGSAVYDFRNPDRIIIGSNNEKAGDALEKIFKPFNSTILRTDIRTAEMIKYANNAFLATKVSFINEIANICKELGVDVNKVAEGIGLDFRINPHFLRAGAGFGGSCFPKDVQALISASKSVGVNPILLNSVLAVNKNQPLKVIELAKELLGSLGDKNITVLGLSFKPNTDDMREAPSIKIISTLLSEKAKVTVYDPAAIDNAKKIFGKKIKYAPNVLEAVKNADCLLIVTEWDEFKNLPLPEIKGLMRNHFIVDGRRILNPDIVKREGFKYKGIGWKE
ncbi:MAG: UDP-glucose/GDP-mannose dehydrogenase family protein [Candidatus Freyarchaeota archaeon]|nr:UDP-glucose/GDP-mannose dehydrogenase family protein [Candidatus Jordarchaeia archaeon]MBS7268939.1 UDP-glucose/GDP-mannose dehydrogenase family protein [Candidatus Jordarchaeia archaeon]MBS7279471.1 UDP-glucose/GDP-mannose dehydrogenase family protein [Candidatus Jordarchaeia archaeon]